MNSTGFNGGVSYTITKTGYTSGTIFNTTAENVLERQTRDEICIWLDVDSCTNGLGGNLKKNWDCAAPYQNLASSK